MKRLAPILLWGLTSAVGASLSAFVFLPMVDDATQVGTLVLALATIFGLAITTTSSLLKDYNSTTIKDLSPQQASRARSILERRRTILWRRYPASIVLSVVATVSAWALRITSFENYHTLFAGLTGAALFPAALIAILAIFESHKLSKVMRELSSEIERRRLQMETIGRLSGGAGGHLEAKA